MATGNNNSNKKKPEKLKPSTLGKGMAQKAASKGLSHQQRMKQRMKDLGIL